MDPLDPEVIDRLLTVLREHAGDRAFHFKCGMFSFAIDGVSVPEEEEQVSTDVRGFAAPGRDEDEDEDDGSELDKMSRHHRSALRGAVPLLDPRKKA